MDSPTFLYVSRRWKDTDLNEPVSLFASEPWWIQYVRKVYGKKIHQFQPPEAREGELDIERMWYNYWYNREGDDNMKCFLKLYFEDPDMIATSEDKKIIDGYFQEFNEIVDDSNN